MRHLSLIIAALLTLSCTEAVKVQSINKRTTTMKSESKIINGYKLKIVYPESYTPEKHYPVMLGLSGGDQSEGIVEYCLNVWFNSSHLENYIKVLPTKYNGKNLTNYTADDFANVLKIVQDSLPTTKEHWIISGTSNGGVASFKFAEQDPKLFEAIFVTPGSLPTAVDIDNWDHITTILAYGDKDSQSWITATERTAQRLENKVAKLEIISLPGVGHILPEGYDMEAVYGPFFDK